MALSAEREALMLGTIKRHPAMLALLGLLFATPTYAESPKHVTRDGILIEVDMVPGADFPMTVVSDNESHTCGLDLGHAGHWPLRGVCWPVERSGPYYKKIGSTYYMRAWDKADAPDHSKGGKIRGSRSSHRLFSFRV
jgi:hypothetical protein